MFAKKAFQKLEKTIDQIKDRIDNTDSTDLHSRETPVALGGQAPPDHPSIVGAGQDPVGAFIRNVEQNHVVPNIGAPFTALWTHAGVIVDKSLLGYDWMEDGKLYIYESVFSGEIVGFPYSKYLPLDQPEVKKFHLGPQIRGFWDVVQEGEADVAICPLIPSERARLANCGPAAREFHQSFIACGYPLSILPQLAAASDALLGVLNKVGKMMSESDLNKKTVFCSELTALLYAKVGVTGFSEKLAATLTPLEEEVMPAFGGACIYAKKGGKLLVKEDMKTLPVEIPRFETPRNAKGITLNWITVTEPNQPVNTPVLGTDHKNQSLRICRVPIGTALHPGTAIGDPATTALVSWAGVQSEIKIRHHILTSLEGTKWVPASKGVIPEDAVPGGYEEDGSPLYIAKALVAINRIFGKDEKCLRFGKTAPHLKGAMFPLDGKEVSMQDGYEILVAV
ncbi:hypothetical protein HK104_003447 [Borealophlyctis nickersoniae]|nr:hypothetical protein HK104_003447 [Borealophlyctis nickersoniae]